MGWPLRRPICRAPRRRSRVVVVEEALEDLPHVARGLGAARVLAVHADADVHPLAVLGEHPAVEGREVPVEDHLDGVGLDGEALPPAHQRGDGAPRARVDREDRVRAVGGEHARGAHLLALARAHAHDAAALADELPRGEPRAEGDPQGLGALDEEVIEVLAEEDDRALRGGQVHLAPAGRDDARGVDEVAAPPHLGADAELVEERHPVGRERRAAGLVAGELSPCRGGARRARRARRARLRRRPRPARRPRSPRRRA